MPEHDSLNVYKEWDHDWFNHIAAEISKLWVSKTIFDDVWGIIHRNPELKERDPRFALWFSENFFVSFTVAIRRIVDSRSGTKSIVGLLRAIKRNPDIVSRKNFSTHYGPTPGAFPNPDRDYDQLIGTGLDKPTARSIQNDIDALESVSASVRELVNTRIAHFQMAPVQSAPDLKKEIDNILEVLSRLFTKYFWLFRGSPADALPTIIGDWWEIFYIPWIDTETSRAKNQLREEIKQIKGRTSK